jgi:hypothetical protein
MHALDNGDVNRLRRLPVQDEVGARSAAHVAALDEQLDGARRGKGTRGGEVFANQFALGVVAARRGRADAALGVGVTDADSGWRVSSGRTPLS